MKEKPIYVISVVSEILGLHPQTLRQYERLGLIVPSRSIGNTRLYSEKDLEQLRYIILLTKEYGVNLAGVEIIINMKKEIKSLKEEIDFLNKYLITQYKGDINKIEKETTSIKKIKIIKE